MRLLTALAITIAAFGVPSLGAALVYTNPVQEQLVEGHSVFSVLEIVNDETTGPVEFAAAVAVLVREVKVERTGERFPGVLWFNDQYLTNPTRTTEAGSPEERYPCTGAVLVVNASEPSPPTGDITQFNNNTYVHSYYITDPNNHAWSIDKWVIDGRYVWTVPIFGNDATYSTPDDGTTDGCRYVDISCAIQRGQTCLNPPGGDRIPRNTRNPGDNGQGYPCTGCSPQLLYNAVLYFLVDDLVQSGTKNHTKGSADYQADGSACHSPGGGAGSNQWLCPGGDDDREGNSHPYNGEAGWPTSPGVPASHGGSADCGGTPDRDSYCHGTYDVDIYYGIAAAPWERHYYVVDVEGSASSYHCHDETRFCQQPEMPVD